MSELWKHLALGFSALLPMINPVGSALIFLGLVGAQPEKVYKLLARRIAVNMILFFLIVELTGAYVLQFFGISLEIVQLAGGIVVAALGWSMLNQQSSEKEKQDSDKQRNASVETSRGLESKTFYPFMFPVTAGPGSIVVMLTLSAHTTSRVITENLLARVGLMIAVILLSVLVYLCYSYAPQLTRKVSPSTVHGILQVMAFIVFCIGAQIAWNGLQPLLSRATSPAAQVNQGAH
jgi:multiple antibiotic resistance protein